MVPHSERTTKIVGICHAVKEVFSRTNILCRKRGHIVRMGEMKNAHKTLVGKPEGTKPLRRSTSRWENNIKKYFEEMGCDGVE
jgi:hypothetical protein